MNIKYHVIYDVTCPALKEMFGLKDTRSVVKRLIDMGVKIHCRGKRRYIITQEVLDCLVEEKEVSYTAKTDLAKRFTEN